MNKYKVCVYAISKNEEKNVKKWVDSMSEADKIVVLDTGSTDNTVKLLEENGVYVKSQIINPWRFDVARNYALDLVPKDYDICVSTDIDERFEKGWRAELEKNWQPDTKQIYYKFIWSKDKNNNEKEFLKEKIHTRNDFKWIYPIHEFLKYTSKEPYKNLTIKDIKLIHYQDIKKERTNYLPLLELSFKENPNYDRNVFYLGREYMYYKKWDKCIETLKIHLKLPTANWADERSASMRYIACAYKNKLNKKEAESWYMRAIAEAPYLREPFLNLAQLYCENEYWIGVVHMVESALNIKTHNNSYLIETRSWGSYPYDIGALGYYKLGLYKKSYEYYSKALKLNPNDERLKNNLKLVKEKLNKS